jgi:integrase
LQEVVRERSGNRMKKTAMGNGVYKDEKGRFWSRPKIGTKRTWRLLRSRAKTEAHRENVSTEFNQRVLFGSVWGQWKELGCPKPNGAPQSADYIKATGYLEKNILAYFGQTPVDKIDAVTVAKYGGWRSEMVVRDGYAGTRAADIELARCSAMCRWAYFAGLITANPFSEKFRFHGANVVEHSPCRAPTDANTVHRIGRIMLSSPRTRPCGFLYMLLSLTGCRTKELRMLRLDGQVRGQLYPAGYFTSTEIVIQRGKNQNGGGLESIRLTPEAQDCLRAWKHWHDREHPNNPWWFPGRGHNNPLDAGSLAKLLAVICQRHNIPHISPHGCRSWFCQVLRTHEPDDRIVAARLGHTSVQMVQAIYGGRMPASKKLSWLPDDGTPAWTEWLPENALTVPMKI